mmetsp:Transcript_85478/g.133569  ORF Transcript_85478/g.133569 Transcript_85478/m.133569 type:complete len:450 (+) Transcript_85478:47-1396(+)
MGGLEQISTCVARRDYAGALAFCNKRLKESPGDRLTLELRQSIEEFTRAVASSELDVGVGSAESPSLDELKVQSREACTKAFEAMFRYLQDEETLCSMGEQAIGIFFDVATSSGPGAFRDRLLEMARSCLSVLERHALTWGKDKDLPEDYDCGSWLFEALGILWFQAELGQSPDPQLLSRAKREWLELKTMEALVGYSKNGLATVSTADLCDVMVSVWTLERTLVCGLLSKDELPLEYGVADVFAEIRRRSFIEPPLAGFCGTLYVATHVVYCLNSWNGYLPNSYSDCPWLYNYIERCLRYSLHEGQYASREQLPKALSSVMPSYEPDIVDVVSESIDCIRGLGEENVTEVVRDGVAWLLTRQREDGFFYSPQADTSERATKQPYNDLHPTWTAAAALHLDRAEYGSSPSPSSHAAVWAKHARAAAKSVAFFDPPGLDMHFEEVPGAES